MKTYFVIVSWNNSDLLPTCIDSVLKQSDKDYSIIVVDNGSNDNSIDLLHEEYPQVEVIDAGKNNGFAIGNNMGIARALEDKDCKYVALLNTDATVDPEWLRTILTFADKHPEGASFQTPTLDYFDHETLDSRGIKIDLAGRAIQLGYREAVKESYDDHQIFGVNAAACIYTADFLKKQPFGSDYLDSDMWMYLEDVDLALRAQILNYESWLVAGAFAYHMGSASSSKNPGFSVFMIYRNNASMLVKNLPSKILMKVVPRLVLSDIVLIAGFLRHRNLRTIKYIIKGRVHSLRRLGLFYGKRKKLISNGRSNTKKLLKYMLD